MVDLSGTKCQAGTGVSVARVPEPRRRVSSRCRIHAVKHEPEFHNSGLCGAVWISWGWPDAAAKRPSGTASDLHFRVGLPGFEPGTS